MVAGQGLGFRYFAVWVEEGHLGASPSKQPPQAEGSQGDVRALPFP